MLNGSNPVTSIGESILGIAGYYTDYDNLQHVIVAAEHGNVYEVKWDPIALEHGHHPHPTKLGYFGDSLATIAGFFTPDDNYHHAVVGTDDGKLHELWFKPSELPPHTKVLPDTISGYDPSKFDPFKGMASFYSTCDNLRHVVVVENNGHPVDITWKGGNPTNGRSITIPPNDSQIASISGFLSYDENPNTRHIIVARNDTGQVYDIDYPDEEHIPHDIRGQDNVYVKATFGEPVKNVTAFFSSDTHYRHIVVLTQENFLKYHAYHPYGGGTDEGIPLTSALTNVRDITSFYNARDQLNHVTYATKDGSLHEITYTSQG
jgi:hypothetical protein